jgi:predicted nucleotidyltransferase
LAAEANRALVREHVLGLAESDSRVVAAAVIGSLAQGDGDRWSDLDLTFGVAAESSVAEVLDDWTRELAEAFDAVPLLDVSRGDLVYRVFLLEDWLQVDLSFAPETVRQTGPAFSVLFGAHSVDLAPAPSAETIFGWAVLYARHAKVGIARGQWWHAEYCVSCVRDHALTLACLRRDLPTGYGKGFDQLPEGIREGFEDALVRSLEREELLRALAVAVAGLLRETPELEIADALEGQLRGLTG